mmetsp:Transcript_19481/g.66237  ORF Transcript_19481/g.66237 Transcript_19481/m.66237 type:complete len:229 (-) Transcript_19481:1237-1923(-)
MQTQAAQLRDISTKLLSAIRTTEQGRPSFTGSLKIKARVDVVFWLSQHSLHSVSSQQTGRKIPNANRAVAPSPGQQDVVNSKLWLRHDELYPDAENLLSAPLLLQPLPATRFAELMASSLATQLKELSPNTTSALLRWVPGTALPAGLDNDWVSTILKAIEIQCAQRGSAPFELHLSDTSKPVAAVPTEHTERPLNLTIQSYPKDGMHEKCLEEVSDLDSDEEDLEDG